MKRLEEKMVQRETVVAQLGAMGRCAMVGTLIGLMTTQAFAASVPASAPQPATLPGTASVPSNVSTQAIDTRAIDTLSIDTTATANVPLAATDNATSDASALPDAPALQGESASLKMPTEMKAMMDDAAQQSQALTAPATKSKGGIQRPGMLVMGIAGIPLAAFGTWVLTRNVSKDATLKNEFGAAFLVPGAAMMGLGFYFAFHKKSQ
jgi:hypothetical protein